MAIFDIAAPGLTVQTLNNIANIYFREKTFEKAFEFLAKAISLSLSKEQFDSSFSIILRNVINMIAHDDWKNLESIKDIYSSGIVTEDSLVNFFTAIYEHALYKTSNESHKENYEKLRAKLSPSLRQLLSEIIEIRK